MVNRNESLTNIERFHYLKFALKSKTSRVLRSLAMSDDNYMTARKLLHEQYEDMMISIASVLRQLIDDFSNNIKSLKSLGEPVDHWDIHLLKQNYIREYMRHVSELGC